MTTGGLDRTFEYLTKVQHDAVLPTLELAFDAGDSEVTLRAVRALLARHQSAGHMAILDRWPTLDLDARDLVLSRPGKMSAALREAILSRNAELCRSACEIGLATREYHIVPVCIKAIEATGESEWRWLAETVLALAERLHDELADFQPAPLQRDPRQVRNLILQTLDQAVQRSDQRRSLELLEAFLLLSDRHQPTLRRILGDPRDKNHATVVDCLTHSSQPGIQRLLVTFLEQTEAPGAVLQVLGRRKDLPFIKLLLRSVASQPAGTVGANLRRMTSLRWLADLSGLLPQLDEFEQGAVARVVFGAGLKRDQAFEALRCFLMEGGVAARRRASAALASFSGSDANDLVLSKLDEPDPVTLANLVRQLRERGVPGTLSRLVELLDHESGDVREAARDALSDFRLAKFLSIMPQLDGDARKQTGKLVRKVDPGALELLERELSAPTRARRILALEACVALDAVSELMSTIVLRVQDDDQYVRAMAARTLAGCNTREARAALDQAAGDSHPLVRSEAVHALELLGPWRPTSVQRPVAPLDESPLPPASAPEVSQ